MAESVVWGGVMGAILASMPALETHIIAFDTEVVDLTEKCHDPVDLLFGVQLGGQAVDMLFEGRTNAVSILQ